jgi:hypothetical protein
MLHLTLSQAALSENRYTFLGTVKDNPVQCQATGMHKNLKKILCMYRHFVYTEVHLTQSLPSLKNAS